MRKPKGFSSLFLLLWLLPFSPTHLAHSQAVLDDMAIVVQDKSREFAFTNKESAYYYGETNSENTNSWQGFNVFGREFVDDYSIIVTGEILTRSSALKTTVYPDELRAI